MTSWLVYIFSSNVIVTFLELLNFSHFPGSVGWPTKREHGEKNFFGAIGGLTLEKVSYQQFFVASKSHAHPASIGSGRV